MSSALFYAVHGGEFAEEHHVRLLAKGSRGRRGPRAWSWGCSCKRYLRMGRLFADRRSAVEEARAHARGEEGGRDA